jgi:hypothetical protein
MCFVICPAVRWFPSPCGGKCLKLHILWPTRAPAPPVASSLRASCEEAWLEIYGSGAVTARRLR